jgi:hypothetical protein
MAPGVLHALPMTSSFSRGAAARENTKSLGASGYDQTSVWVADGCSAEFATGPAQPETKEPRPPTHVPNVGFLLFDGEKGQIYFRLFSYGRYLNQRNPDESCVDDRLIADEFFRGSYTSGV